MNDLAQLSVSKNTGAKTKVLFGQILLESGRITNTHVTKIIAAQARHNLRFGDTAVKLGFIDKTDVTKALAKQFDYASSVDEKDKLADQKAKFDKRLAIIFEADSPQAEAIRSLRSELLMRYFNNSIHRNLALVSTEDSENLTMTTASLGIAFSQLGLKTLVIDANLRSPQLGKLFNISERSVGLADLLSSRGQSEALAVSSMHSLWILPAGTPVSNPQELLASKYFAQSVERLSEEYDITLINTSASNVTRDAHLVATQSGACLVIAKQDSSRLKDLKNLCTSFKTLGVRILGVALWQ